MVSTKAYDKTISALDEYAKFQLSSHPKGQPKLLLKVTSDRSGERYLTVISQKDLSIFDKILHFFGLGGLTLRRVVNFLEASDFGKEKLDDKELRSIEHALHHLDIKIKKYNHHHFFEIHTKRKNLTISVRELFSRFAEPERSLKPLAQLPIPHDLKKAKVQEEILSGSTVASSIKDPPLQNFAFIVQEIRKVHNRTEPRSSIIETTLLENSTPTAPSRLDVLDKQEEFLKRLLQDDNLQQKSPEAVQKEVYKTKFFAHLAAAGIPESDFEGFFHVFEFLMEKKKEIAAEYNKQGAAIKKEIVSRSLPAIAENSLIVSTESLLNQTMYDKLLKVVADTAQALQSKKLNLENCKAYMEAKIQKPEDIAFIASEIRDRKVLDRIAFFVKWQKHLDKEMVQGFSDRGETLGRGICWALSLRWLKDELKMAKHTDTKAAIREMKIGKTFGEDRKLQVAYEHVWKGKNRMAGLKKLQRSIGIVHSYHAHSEYDFSSKEEIAKSLQKLGQNVRFQKSFNGIGQLEIRWDHAAHVICLVMRKDLTDPSKCVFRFSEPNFGTYHFTVDGRSPLAIQKAEEKLCECLADLITTFYTKNLRGLNVECFAQTKSSS